MFNATPDTRSRVLAAMLKLTSRFVTPTEQARIRFVSLCARQLAAAHVHHCPYVHCVLLADVEHVQHVSGFGTSTAKRGVHWNRTTVATRS